VSKLSINEMSPDIVWNCRRTMHYAKSWAGDFRTVNSVRFLNDTEQNVSDDSEIKRRDVIVPHKRVIPE
jgi:hypothetical protein